MTSTFTARALAAAFLCAALLLHLQAAPRPCVPQPQGPQNAPPAPAGAPASSYRITGIVVDAGSGVPLEGVEVQGAQLSTGPPPPGANSRPVVPLVIATGADGRFAFEGVAPGRYLLSARKRGYPPMNYQQHESVWTAVIVGPGLDTENLVFQLRAGAVITGQVTDESGEPVRNAQMMLFRQSLASGESAVQFAAQKQTDDLGRCRFSGLQPGTYFVGVSAQPWYATSGAALNIPRRVVQRRGPDGSIIMTSEGLDQPPPEPDPLDVVYAVTYYPGTTDAGRAGALTLLPGDQASADLVLAAVPSVHIRLRAPAGSDPAAYFNVTGMQSTMGNHDVGLPARVFAMAPDHVDVSIPPGRAVLNVLQFSQVQTARISGDVQQARMEGTRWQPEIDASRDTEIQMTAQTAGPIVAGTVKPPGSAAVPRPCTISIRNRETGQGPSAQIGADGAFSFPIQQQPALRRGWYDVFLAGCPALHVAGVTSTANVKTEGRSFELGAEPVRLSVELGAGLGRLDGVVLRDDKPAGGVMVLLVPADGPVAGSLIQRNQSNTDGSFFWNAIRPGRYTVVALDNGWNLEWAKPEVLKPLLAAGQTVQIEGGGQHKVTLKVQ